MRPKLFLLADTWQVAEEFKNGIAQRFKLLLVVHVKKAVDIAAASRMRDAANVSIAARFDNATDSR